MALQMCLDRAELAQQLVVLQDLDVFHMEVGLIVALELLVGAAWIDTLQDAEFAEVGKVHLAGSDGI